MLESKEKSSQEKSTELNRHQWISVAAYFKAEARDFEPGKELDDWLAAEIEYTKYQIKTFLLVCEEDGVMSITDLQGLAYSVGVAQPELLDNKIELIREIQKASHNSPCFHSENRMHCEEPDCQWQTECRKLIAIWNR